jgi:hypothetical protein
MYSNVVLRPTATKKRSIDNGNCAVEPTGSKDSLERRKRVKFKTTNPHSNLADLLKTSIYARPSRSVFSLLCNRPMKDGIKQQKGTPIY